MTLSSDIISQFVKLTNEKDKEKPKTGSTVNGTTVEYNGSLYVKLDGSDLLTPVNRTVDANPGERVTVTIKDHTATITGNTSSPSARTDDVKEIGNKITEAEILIAGKVDTEELVAEKARIDELVAENVTVKERLTATEADIGTLTAKDVTIEGKLEAAEAEIDNLEAKKIDAEVADLTYATIENLEATDANLYNLEATYGQFKDLSTSKFSAIDADIEKLNAEKLDAESAEITYATINELDATKAEIDILDGEIGDFKNLTADNFNAVNADIEKLNAEKLDVESAEITYANIDFANIGEAAIEKLFSDSGIIDALVMSEGHVTGKLVGVTIKGDLIEGGTIIADKLVIQGDDGLYYKLNTNGERVTSQQTDRNSLNGSIITANTITAEKINVDDLVAFNATIGGFNITNNSIYSGAKSSVNNTTRGIYQDNTGQIAFGDSNRFLKYFKDSDGNWKLSISVDEIKMVSSDKTIEEEINDVKNSVSNIEIGGRNLITESETVGVWYCAYGNNPVHSIKRSELTYVVNGRVITNPYVASFVYGGTGDFRFGRYHNTDGTSGGDATRGDRFDLSNKTYTMSVWVMPNVDTVLTSFVTRHYQDSDGSSQNHNLKANVWTRIAHSRTFSSRSDIDGIRVRFTMSNTVNVLFCMGKIEKGNVATDWTPAPEDSENDLATFASEVTSNIDNLQSQIDGNITTWFYNYEPTSSNIPASNWTTTELKNQHLGDLFYIINSNDKTGQVYRWALVNNAYSWVIVEDADVTKALADAAKAQDTADSKRRVFVSTPTVPYDVGDIWTQGTNGDIMICVSTRSTGGYTSSDWDKASKYTDDTAINNLQVGARNLARNTAKSVSATATNNAANNTWYAANSYWCNHNIVLESGQDYILSFDYDIDYSGASEDFSNSTITSIGCGIGGGNTPTTYDADMWDACASFYRYGGSNKSGHFVYYMSPRTFSNTRYFAFRILRIYPVNDACIGTKITISNFKLEKGNKATDWTPAPEDVQSDIDTAKTNADKALSDLSVLTQRVTTAETSITQNKEAITLTATKTEVTEAIKSVEVGGRNLARATKEEWSSWITPKTNATNQTCVFAYAYLPDKKTAGDSYTMSLEIEFDNVAAGTGGTFNFYSQGNIDGKLEGSNIWSSTAVRTLTNLSDGVHKISWTNKLAANVVDKTVFELGFRADYWNGVGRYRCRKIKLEKGTKATDWTPAPEDVAANTQAVADNLANNYYNKTQTDAAIQVKSDSIVSSVSATYATKVENQNAVDKANTAQTTANNANTAAANAQSTANTAKTNAATAQTTANNANTAAANAHTAATNAQNTANTANTAAANAQSTANNIQVGGRNLIMNSDVSHSRDKNATAVGTFSGIKFSSDTDLQSLVNQTLTLSLYFDTPGDWVRLDGQPESMNSRFGMHCTVFWGDSSGTLSNKVDYPFAGPTLVGIGKNKTRVSHTQTLTPPTGYDTLVSFAFASQFYAKPASNNDVVWVCEKPKLEFGNRATDWTPAPEDISSDIAEVNENTADAVERITVAESTILQLSDAISSLVQDENGTSLMTQTSNGWTFNIGSIQKSLETAHNDIKTATGSITSANSAISNLNKLVSDISNKTAYIIMATDDNGNPCIELGKADNDFKVRITNTSLDFLEGSSKIAWINNKSLYITKAVIKEELQIGETTGFVWKIRSNGNMGLIWIG